MQPGKWEVAIALHTNVLARHSARARPAQARKATPTIEERALLWQALADYIGPVDGTSPTT